MSSSERRKIHAPLVAVPNPPDDAAPLDDAPLFASLPEYLPAERAGVCVKCNNSGWEQIQNKGVRRCECSTRKSSLNLQDTARIPARYRNCDLHNFFPQGHGTQLSAFYLANRLVSEYPAVDRGLLFMGSVGVGKTHLSVAILRGLLNKGVSCMFYDFGSMLKEIQDSYSKISNTSELGLLAPVFNTEVLVLDELGASKPTDWVRDTMMHVIGKRYNEQKLTIITTNYSDTRRGEKEETLEDRIGVRLRSRLYEMCKTVVIEGEDYRRKRDAQQF